MARGWESKSVESQIEDRARPRAGAGPSTGAERERVARRAACELSRARVIDELAKVRSDARRAALEAALAAIEAELAALGPPT